MRIDFDDRAAEGDPWVPNTLVERSPWGSADGLELAVTVGTDGAIDVDLSAF
ncbi:hypothetical protein GCM10011490_04040 [Pseudoclavibacter endophyticus]|uniref:hypothetical protein n=1 Tax=Pseudoclavibacter endophyticus TaxID=1778590 RepID=UPI001663D11B|nr:hypothetical protein [Pseudoclavibacter endophyticus]GGA57464.1 hypothetical protein GCM10011490_04040 [Pseudoclavibacter endophyticus]